MCKKKETIDLKIFEVSSVEKKDSAGEILYEEMPTGKVLRMNRVDFEKSTIYNDYSNTSNQFRVTKQVMNMYGFTNHTYVSYFNEAFINDANGSKIGMRIKYADGHGEKLWWVLKEIQ